jgi:hypothetical protein
MRSLLSSYCTNARFTHSARLLLKLSVTLRSFGR